jgi:hypothetical protein
VAQLKDGTARTAYETSQLQQCIASLGDLFE